MDFFAFVKLLDKLNVKYELSKKTSDLVSFRVGGIAKIVVYPNNTDKLVKILNALNGEKFEILGNGTNTYFNDEPYEGVVVCTKLLNRFSIKDELIICDCGVLVHNLCNSLLEYSLGGLEFAYGIPGTIGGCVSMNASAFGSDFSKIVIESEAYDSKKGLMLTLDNSSHNFQIKNSIFRTDNLILLNTKIRLKNEDKSLIQDKMRAYMKRRKETQPLNLPSAGSVFIRPEGFYAGDLIEKCGLKGYTVGGAQISTKHAGFIVNIGNASSKDINDLIELIKIEVFKRFNVKLKEEIIYVD